MTRHKKSDILCPMKSKDLLIVSTHSFVDLITNSSTELYVCDGKKTIDTIVAMLKTMLKHHDELTGQKHTFEQVFRTPEVSKFTFLYYNATKPVIKDYNYHHRYNAFEGGSYSYSDINPEERKLEDAERRVQKTLNVYEPGLDEKDKKEYKRRWDLYRKQTSELWTPYGSRKFKSVLNLFLDFLTQNEFSTKEIEKAQKICESLVKKHVKKKQGQYSNVGPDDFPGAIGEAFENFNSLESWGINTKKGDIFVYSADDNSIPYELMDSLTSYLNAQRYHLG